MDQWHGKNPRSGNIKGAKATTKRHSAKKHLIHQKSYKSES